MTEDNTVHDISSLPPRKRKVDKKKILTVGAIGIAAFASILIIDDYLHARKQEKDEKDEKSETKVPADSAS